MTVSQETIRARVEGKDREGKEAAKTYPSRLAITLCMPLLLVSHVISPWVIDAVFQERFNPLHVPHAYQDHQVDC
jgi:hypothetical protein